MNALLPKAIDNLEIPNFLRISGADRRKAWEGRPYTSPHKGDGEAWRKQEVARRTLYAAEKKAKNAVGLARLKAEHEGEKYDRKRKQWVRV